MSIRCALVLVLSLRTTFIGLVLPAPTILRAVTALSAVPTFDCVLVLLLVLVLAALAVIAPLLDLPLPCLSLPSSTGSYPSGCDGSFGFVLRACV